MKYKIEKIPLTDLINRNKFISLIAYPGFHLFFLAFRKFNRLFSYKDGNLIVIILQRLGDTVFTIPAVREIQKHFNRKIIIVCFPELISVFELALKDLDYCVVEPDNFYFGRRIANRRVVRRLRSLKPYKIFDLTGTMASASLIFNVRAREIIGIGGKQFRKIYDRYVAVRESPKLADIYLDAISPVIRVQNRDELIKYPVLINPVGKILIHPFAGWREKEWGLRNFINLAKKVSTRYNVSIISPADRISGDELQEIGLLGIEIIRTGSIQELIKQIKMCSLFIGNDSGPVNLANFIGKPTYTIYGSTNPDYTASVSDHQLYIQNVLACSAKENEKFCIIGAAVYDCPGIQCMNQLTVDRVYDDLMPLIRRYCTERIDS